MREKKNKPEDKRGSECKHFRLYISGDMSPLGGVTIALSDYGDRMTIGASFCSPIDRFVRGYGTIRAIGRSGSNIATTTFPGDDAWVKAMDVIRERVDYLMRGKWGEILTRAISGAPGKYHICLMSDDGLVLWNNAINIGVWEG